MNYKLKDMKYYDIHFNDGVSSYSKFIQVKDNLLTSDANDDDILGFGVDIGMIDPDEMEYKDKITEIDEAEYNKAIQA